MFKVRPMSTFRIQEFAKLAGVTVRALHHYDRLKLLSPAHRSERGYRLYCHEDLGRLERILALRYLGLSLREIAALLNTPIGRGAEPLTVTLARQRAALRERRDGLDRVLRAIEHAQRRAQDDPAEPEWLLYQTILKEIQMQEATDWTEKYYSPKAVEALRERRAALTPEQKAESRCAMAGFVRRYSERAGSTRCRRTAPKAGRWSHAGCAWATSSRSEIRKLREGYRRMYDDESHWPDDEKAAKLRATMPKPEYWSFFHQAVQACLRHG